MFKASVEFAMRLAVFAAVPVLAFASAAAVDEAIPTHTDQPPAAEPAAAPVVGDDPRQANGDWARRILAGQSSEKQDREADGKGCRRNDDRKPHGAVWAGVGTGGYRNVGGVVTQPIGACGSATIAIDHTQFDGIRRGRRR
jgi:hypothetical protein